MADEKENSTPVRKALSALNGNARPESGHFSRPQSRRFSSLLEESPAGGNGRRDSGFSNFSLDSAAGLYGDVRRDRGFGLQSEKEQQDGGDTSIWQSAPLVFALLPAVGGMFFKNGSAVISDVLLLGLAAIFLNWSVRLPWEWYRSAQELRQEREQEGNTVAIDESDSEHDQKDTPPTPRKLKQIANYDQAVRELYRHEVGALICCFVFPILGAYLLHTIRDSLSRPSEGLVSNYNLTIFLLAAELRPLRHMIKLILSRTLHLQRIVKDNPYTSVDEEQNASIKDMMQRLGLLEDRVRNGISEKEKGPAQLAVELDSKTAAGMVTELRRSVQPDLDALNRAVRRYEKRVTLQAMQTESRLLDIESRLAEAISLAAAAAQSGQRPKTLGVTAAELLASGIMLPFQTMGSLAQLPFTVMALLWDLVRGTAGPSAKERTRESHSLHYGTSGGRSSGSERERIRLARRGSKLAS